MKQKVLIEINSPKPLNTLGNHVLFWDATKENYYAMTLADFLAPQNNKIKQLEEKIVSLENEFNETQKTLQTDYNSLKKTLLKEKQEFLATYKDTNSKVIEMVKSFLDKQGE